METQTRKAVLTKNVKLSPKAFSLNAEAKKFKKGTEVLIKDEAFWKGVRQYSMKLADGSDATEYKITPSQFEFSEKAKFIVLVTRTSYASRNIEVEAMDAKEAERLALSEAGNHEFSEHDADYGVDCVAIED